VSGSVSVLHVPTGLSFTAAGGQRTFIEPVTFTDGTAGARAGANFFYTKLGWRGHINSLGQTATYAEYGRFDDVLGGDADASTIEGLADLKTGQACALPGSACLVSDSQASVWGAGMVQSIDATGSLVYISVRHFEADVSLTDRTRSRFTAAPVAGLDLVMAGLLIEF
jgi:hypothetical protein